MRTIGLTGGIGSGKSTVAQMLVARGAQLVDTDAIARALTLTGGTAMPALAEAFGPAALTLDGALDREYMRRRVFGDAGARSKLEGILHPLIGQEAQREAAMAGGRQVVFDVPLLAESSHWRQRVDRILVVDCSEASQVARVALRPGWDEATAWQVVKLQAARAARRHIADAVIHNDGIELADLDKEVAALCMVWTSSGQ